MIPILAVHNVSDTQLTTSALKASGCSTLKYFFMKLCKGLKFLFDKSFSKPSDLNLKKDILQLEDSIL